MATETHRAPPPPPCIKQEAPMSSAWGELDGCPTQIWGPCGTPSEPRGCRTLIVLPRLPCFSALCVPRETALSAVTTVLSACGLARANHPCAHLFRGATRVRCSSGDLRRISQTWSRRCVISGRLVRLAGIAIGRRSGREIVVACARRCLAASPRRRRASSVTGSCRATRRTLCASGSGAAMQQLRRPLAP